MEINDEDKRPLKNVDKLTMTSSSPSHENSKTWSSAMTVFWRRLETHGLIVKEEKLDQRARLEQVRAFESRYKEAINIYSQIVEIENLTERNHSPDELNENTLHIIWKYLKAKYEIEKHHEKNSLFYFVFQASSLVMQLSKVFEKSSIDTLSCLENFETEWLFLKMLAKISLTENYQQDLFQILQEDMIKSKIFLGLLSQNHSRENLDNLVKEDHTFVQLKEHLINMTTNNLTSHIDATNADPNHTKDFSCYQEKEVPSNINNIEKKQAASINKNSIEAKNSKLSSKFPNKPKGASETRSSPKNKEVSAPSSDFENQSTETRAVALEKEVVTEERFDYSKAQSLLTNNGKREGCWDDNLSKNKKKPFDPYLKSMNAPKGMRRSQNISGKSHTFRR
ncbi:putative exosome complex exonuclease rrp6 [Golovinomyces cichoracearum]|uniref:Putative exosome complex exonuclease rrp6 n=1 Tax=Golovinomyces cichoracearum TaxID=62708 RepID=A0A420IRW9_9PEZI|nr:putative exosome complex exonuclease rrp6 [Golovinomyces cichoracearum]